MKLVDKMILFSRFLRENKKHKLHLTQTLKDHKSYFSEQSKYWRNRSSYEYIDSTIDNISSLSDIYENTIDQMDSKINELLRKEELIVIERDYKNYEKTERNLELMIERVNTSKEFIDIITTEIGNLSDWRYPGVELNPTDGTLTHSMLACDPLYVYSGTIVDTNSIKSKFNSFFAEKRLMFYNKLEDLPQNQFGLATSINYYEFLPIDPIKDDMKKVYNILRPGGYFIFTYSNCELETQLDFLAGIEAYICYNTKTLMTSMIQMLGFDLVKEESLRDGQSWMVIKKPGERTSTKLSAPLVTITDKF